MRPIRTLMLALLIAGTLSVTPGYGSSPPGNVSKIEKVKSSDIYVACPAVLVENQDNFISALSYGAIYPASLPVVTKTATVELKAGTAVEPSGGEHSQVKSAITNIKIQMAFYPRKPHSLHIDPGLFDNRHYFNI